MENRDYLIEEKPLKALLILALPMIAGNIFQQFYTMADSMIVGRLVGENALASIGASYALTTVFISIAIGGGVGSSVITSRAFGAKDYQKVKDSAKTAIISFLVIGGLLASFGLAFSENILVLLNTPEEIMEEADVYLGIYFLGLPFLFLYNVLSSVFNALGKSKVPLYLLIFSSSLNIVLDLWMVGPLEMGVAGAAWATLISQGISALISLFVMVRNRHDARAIGRELVRSHDACRVLRGNAHREHSGGPVLPDGQCDVVVCSTEHRGEERREGERGL